jgi:hypothetical protein
MQSEASIRMGARLPVSWGAACLHMKGSNLNQTTPLLGRKVGEDSTCKLSACQITGLNPASVMTLNRSVTSLAV